MNQIAIGDRNYGIEERIGNWGRGYAYPVHRATRLPAGLELPSTAMNIMSRIIEDDWVDVNAEIAEIMEMLNFEHNILLPEGTTQAVVGGVDTLFTVVPTDNLSSLRSLLVGDFENGMNLNCVAFLILETIVALNVVNHFHMFHGQLSAGTVFLMEQPAVPGIKLAFGPTSHELDVDAGPPNFLPANRIPEWAVPDGVENALHPQLWQKLDTWFLGVLAVELFFGKVQVTNREEFMNIVEYIRGSAGLPRQWGHLRWAARRGHIDKRYHPDVTRPFIEFLHSCFNPNIEDIPYPHELLVLDFLNPTGFNLYDFLIAVALNQ